MNSGVYIHIPFCEQRCFYCAFTVSVAPESAFEPYVNCLIREIRLSGFREAPGTVYLGGGTPSLLPPAMLRRILDGFVSMPEEVSLEVNPGTLSVEKLEAWREMGVTRISLGAQSLEDEDLRRAGRLHAASAVLEDFELLRRHGFSNINLDLIAGLPQQALSTWTRNLDGVLRLRPEHVSVYMLDVEERSTWGRHLPVLPEEEDFAAFYAEAETRLAGAGYVHYEISNWALPGRECRHNLGYWNGMPYRGFGVGAHSYDGTRRFWNTTSMAEYAERLDTGKLPLAGEEALSREIRIEEALMLGLRQASGLNVRDLAARLDVQYPAEWFNRVRELQESGHVEFDGERLRLTANGRLVANVIIEELLWPRSSSIFEATP